MLDHPRDWAALKTDVGNDADVKAGGFFSIHKKHEDHVLYYSI